MTAAVAAAGALALVLSGCTSDGGTDGDTAKPVDTDALVTALPAATKDVDSVTWGLVEGEPLSLIPGQDYNFVSPNLCTSLLTLNGDFTAAPGIAEKADWVNPVTFQIDLRDGVKFWDGNPVTPEDVVYSLTRHWKDVTDAFYGAFVFVKSISITGDNQVTVSFTAPDSTFRDAMTGGSGAVLEKAFSEKAGKALGTAAGGVMCAGPYKLDKWTPGQDIVTTANEDYWDGAPKVKTLTYQFISDGATMTNALLSGDVDGAYNVAPSSRATFESAKDGKLYLGPSTSSFSFGPVRDTGLGANIKIRQALNLAIDRQQYIQTVLHGLGYVQSTFVAPFSWSGSPAADTYQKAYDALPEPKVDLEAAKKLVEESGEDTSQPINLGIPAGSKELSQTAAIVQSAAQQIGLTVKIEELQAADFSAIFVDKDARGDLDLISTVGYTETPGVLTYPQLFVLPPEQGGIFNWTGYDKPEVTQLIQSARTATDPQAAAESYVKAQEIFAPDMLQVTLAGAYHTTFLNNRLTGAVTSVASYSTPWAAKLGGK
ncbi:ABC transporter substrate-binding protein [Microbacterium horticulturae]|uniref:ABC transporter substrate-binding protein n=1 Tax=Microbacterium horticulturae TaxID=3028316 RepID=A0ABY8C3C7_9MICO|nr:ABC transporter substrate-binding protein [Microbacterium sp. KACC 23027]WEG09343.1 ABC transporter substrate-binding protein [Microbacterium sp. KACC 23027]